MNWFRWFLVVMFAAKALALVGGIGNARDPLTKDDAFWQVVISAMLIAGVVLCWK